MIYNMLVRVHAIANINCASLTYEAMTLNMFVLLNCFVFFFQAEDGIRDLIVTGVQTCALPIYWKSQTFLYWEGP